MRIEIDTKTKTVTILDECKLSEIVKMLKVMHPKTWEKWTITPQIVTTVSAYPVWISPPYVPVQPTLPWISCAADSGEYTPGVDAFTVTQLHAN